MCSNIQAESPLGRKRESGRVFIVSLLPTDTGKIERIKHVKVLGLFSVTLAPQIFKQVLYSLSICARYFISFESKTQLSSILRRDQRFVFNVFAEACWLPVSLQVPGISRKDKRLRELIHHFILAAKCKRKQGKDSETSCGKMYSRQKITCNKQIFFKNKQMTTKSAALGYHYGLVILIYVLELQSCDKNGLHIFSVRESIPVQRRCPPWAAACSCSLPAVLNSSVGRLVLICQGQH